MNNTKNHCQEIEYIHSLEEKENLNKADWERLKEFSESPDSEVRIAVSEVLVNFCNGTSERILLKMLDDADVMVQASASDSLCFSSSPDVLDKLIGISGHKKFLVRGYAALSIGDIQHNIGSNSDRTETFLKKWFKTERSVWVKTAIARSLFLIGNDEYLPFMLEQLDNKNYQIRCMALNTVSEFAERGLDRKTSDILCSLKKRKKAEKVQHISEKISLLIGKYENMIQ